LEVEFLRILYGAQERLFVKYRCRFLGATTAVLFDLSFHVTNELLSAPRSREKQGNAILLSRV
jgi:hypothetical protein